MQSFKLSLPEGLTPDMLRVFETLPDPYLIFSPELIILTASNAYLEATLMQRESLVGKSVAEAFPDPAEAGQRSPLAGMKESVREVLATRKPHRTEQIRYNLPDPARPGEVTEHCWVALHVPVLNEAGEVLYIIRQVRDLTWSIQSEKELRESQQREQAALAEAEGQRRQLHDILMQAPATIIAFRGPEHTCVLANPAYQQLVGHRELVGKPIREAVPEITDQPFLLGLLDQVYRTGESVYHQEVEAQSDRSNTGVLEAFYFNIFHTATRNGAGQTDGVIAFAHDVTAQVEARKHVQHLNGELAAANEALRTTNGELEQAKNALQQLNHQLEERVETRTRQLQQAQAEAHRQRERLERFFMQAPAAICVLDGPELVYELVNPEYEQLFPGRSLLGRPVLEAIPEFVGRPNALMLQNVYLTGQTFHGRELPVPLARHEGGEPETLYFNFTYQARRNERGQVDGILVFAYEVTSQVLARKEMEKNARQLRLITDAMPVLIGYLDKEEKYRFANQAYQSWFDQNPEALLGRLVREVVGEKAYGGVKKYIEQALSGEKVNFEAMMPYRENLVKYIRASYVPDKQQGEVVGFFTLVMDMTDQRKTEEKLQFLTGELAAANQELRVANEQVQAANEKLARSNRELTRINQELGRTNVDLDNFIYTASHDLKAPIANIEGFLKAMDRKLSTESRQNETVQQIFQMLYGSVNRFKTTIRDLTEVAKIGKEDSGDADSLYLAGVLEEVLEDLKPQIQESQARLEIRLDCETVHFSRKNLKSILYNLVSNALKYRSPDRVPVVHIYCRRQDAHNVFTVQDNGLGIDMRQEEKLFALFKRLHSHVEGTGIGLYIVKRIIENAGGKIQVDSKVGVGSTFKVFFPG